MTITPAPIVKIRALRDFIRVTENSRETFEAFRVYNVVDDAFLFDRITAGDCIPASVSIDGVGSLIGDQRLAELVLLVPRDVAVRTGLIAAPVDVEEPIPAAPSDPVAPVDVDNPKEP